MSTSVLEQRLEGILRQPTSKYIDNQVNELLSTVGTDSICAILFYGSYKSHTVTNQEVGSSYVDFYVVLKDGKEEEFYQHLISKKREGFSQWHVSLSTLKAVVFHNILPPTMYDFTHRDEEGRMVRGSKFCVISRQDLERDLSLFASDHHQRARFAQPMVLAYPRNEETFHMCAAWLAMAHRNAFDFVMGDLPENFDVREFVHQFLLASYTSEVRPEIEQKVESILQKESDRLLGLYGQVLEEKVRQGRLKWDARARTFQLQPDMVPLGTRAKSAVFRFKTKSREFCRWWKNMLTFDNWIDYICDKVERNIGYRIKVAPFERRFWFLAVWWKLIEFLLAKHRHERALKAR